MSRSMYLFFALLILSACASAPNSSPKIEVSSNQRAVTKEIIVPKPPLLDSAFANIDETKAEAIISINDVFALTQSQEKDFFEKYNSPKYSNLTPNRRIGEYLENHLENFNFHSDTLIATNSLAKDLGNCLSLAILTKSLSKLADVEIAYQLVETPPVYQKENGLLLSSQHVRTVLYNSTDAPIGSLTHLFRGKIYIDYFPSAGTRFLRKVDENEFFSMFYRNKAVEAMIANKLNIAFANLKKALAFKQDDGQAINIMAVLHQKVNQFEYAEKLYLYGLKYSKDKFELLNNYHSLLERLNRHDEAKKIAHNLESYVDPNPFKWVALGDKAYHAKDYYAAISYYRKATKMAEYLHEPHAGIARSHYMLGNIQMAQVSMNKALKNSHREQTISLYQRKYELFSKQLEEQ